VASIAIAFMAVTLLSVPGFGGSAYAVGVGMSISADANAGSHSIMISGTTDRSNDVVIIVTAPNGNRVSVDQVTPSGNSYSATIGIGGNQYNQDGMYTILVQQGSSSVGQGKYKLSVEVEITSGTTSATSVSKTSCFGPCEYDPSRTATGGTTSPEAIELTKQGAWNSGGQLSITADAVLGSTTINVSGTTIFHSEIMLKVIAPNGNVVAIDQVTPSSDGSYSATIGIGGNQYNQDGMYTIIATQSFGSASSQKGATGPTDSSTGLRTSNVHQLITASTEVEIADGHVIPEFGTIAVMILVVAIVAIVAVSAKSRLSLVQRF